MPWPTLTSAEATTIVTGRPVTVPSDKRSGGMFMFASMSPRTHLEIVNVNFHGPNVEGFDGLFIARGRSDNVTIEGFDRGLVIPDGGHHRARGLHVDGNVTGIDNCGEFDGPDTVIE
jgi:hypothetical protein